MSKKKRPLRRKGKIEWRFLLPDFSLMRGAFIRVKFLGFDIGINKKCEFWESGLSLCFWGYGFGYLFPDFIWRINEPYHYFWGAEINWNSTT